VERLAKHISLLQTFEYYACKKFYIFGPCVLKTSKDLPTFTTFLQTLPTFTGFFPPTFKAKKPLYVTKITDIYGFALKK